MNASPNSCDALLGGSGAAAGAPDGNPWAYSAGVFPGCSAPDAHIAVAEFPYLHCPNVTSISSFEFVIVTTSGQIATATMQFKVIPAIDNGPNSFTTQLSMALPAGAHTSTLGPFSGGMKDDLVDATSAVVTLLSFDPGITMQIDAIGIRYFGTDLSSCTHP
jgi:hypothetical protein